MISINKALSTDSKRIRELLEYIFKLHYDKRPDLFSGGAKYSIEQINDLIADDSNYFITVKSDDYVIGYLLGKTIFKNERKILYIDDLCIDESYKRSGFGKMLMDNALEYAKANDYDRIELNVYEFNEKAKKFYLSLGYQTQKSELEIVLK